MSTKEELKAKTARLDKARLKAEEFVTAGGDLKSAEAVPIGMELIDAFNEVSTLFGHPILKDVSAQPSTPGGYLQQVIDQKTREAAKSNNAAGLVAMWPAAVKEVVMKFPELSPAEKAALRSNVEGQVRLLCTRTGSDPHLFTPALQEVARLLGM